MDLNTQISEYDCAPTTLLNALRMICKRDEIPVELIRIIYHNTLDAKYKVIGDCGTSRKAMKKICKKINRYSKKHNFDLNLQYLNKKNCTFENIKECLNSNGVVIVRSFLDLEHYYLIVKMDNNYVYIWDPYSLKKLEKNCNLKIDINILNDENQINYSLGPLNRRELVFVKRILLK